MNDERWMGVHWFNKKTDKLYASNLTTNKSNISKQEVYEFKTVESKWYKLWQDKLQQFNRQVFIPKFFLITQLKLIHKKL